ncbi:hypothetical protein GOBAR_DD13913 [Gossypium barbadense]|nr:hypothetical protein GOBAR_DD13913 [Gossypium barbadense]
MPKELSSPARMSVSFKYWDECADPEDMEAMWNHPEVRTEWTGAGETEGQRVHLSRDPDGQPYLTQTEMRAVAEIVTRRQFDKKLDPEMICAIAELESNRQPLAMGCDKKTNLITIGIMQVAPKVAEWIVREEDYLLFPVEEDPDILYKPFVNVYFGAAYLRWLSNFDGKKQFDGPSPIEAPTFPTSPVSPSKGFDLYWDSRVSSEDMEHMWNHLDVFKEWIKSKEIRGKVRFSCNKEKKPYLSRVELRAIAEIIVSKYFSTRGINPTVLCALADVVSMRFIDGNETSTGLMGIDYSTAFWLYKEMGYRAYRVDYIEDLTNPFVSMYFGAAYLAWLSEYEGRERSLQFIFHAYISGPKNVHLEETCPKWLKFEQILARYERTKSREGSCNII